MPDIEISLRQVDQVRDWIYQGRHKVGVIHDLHPGTNSGLYSVDGEPIAVTSHQRENHRVKSEGISYSIETYMVLHCSNNHAAELQEAGILEPPSRIELPPLDFLRFRD